MNYGYIRELNCNLLDKYNNNEEELTFIDYYLFQLTSFGLSLFREHMLNNSRISLSEAFLIRCIIEDIAVMRMYDIEEIPDDCTDLLKGYQFIGEYKIFKKHKNLDGIVFSFNDIEQNFNDVKDFYYQKFGSELSSKKFRSIVNGRLPFLMENYSFHSLIEMYCPEFLDIYQQLSIIIHPSEIITNYCYLQIDLYQNVLKPIFETIVKEISKYYPNLTPTYNHEWGYECAYCFGTKDSYSDIVNIHFSQLYFLKKLKQQIRKDSKLDDDMVCLPEVFFGRIYDELESIIYDRAFGFSEVIKSKIKPIFEFFAVFYYALTVENNYDILNLMQAYTMINYLKVMNEDIEDEIKKIYPLYKRVFNNEILYEDFVKIITNKSMPEFLGFDDINSFVFKMIDELVIDLLWQKDMFKMLYEESQTLSHGNGYMLSSNYGTFMDVDAACGAIDVLILALLGKYNDTIQKNNVTKKLKYDIKKLYKEYIMIHKEKKENEIKIKSKMKNIK